jgi:glycerol-3-phosphate dehydrogenase
MRTDPSALDGSTPDVLVIGGGIHGAAVAREAALRGLATVLLEKGDLASGTSSRSSRLIHGGLRYLEQGRLRMVREALVERTRLLRAAPHLVRPLPMLMPMYDWTPQSAFVLRTGLRLYDLLALGSPMPRSRSLTADACRTTCPQLRGTGLRHGLLYHDAATNDRLLTLAVAAAASEAGARIANHVEVLGLRDGEVTATDSLTGDVVKLRPARIVNAAGVWIDQVRLRLGITAGARVRTSRGSHIVLPRPAMAAALAFFLPDRRIQFLVPGEHGLMAGTTDVDDPTDPDRIATPEEDVRYLLESSSLVLDPPARKDEVTHAWVGLRALVNEKGNPGRISREAALLLERTGGIDVLSIIGGKLTTHRSLAEKALAKLLGRDPGPSPTRERPLPGGELPLEPPPRWPWLASRYGDRFPRVLALAEGRPGLLEPVCPHRRSLRAEACYAIRSQGARTLSDLLLGRLEADGWPCLEESCLRTAAQILAEEVGDIRPADREISELRREVRLLRGSTASAVHGSP